MKPVYFLMTLLVLVGLACSLPVNRSNDKQLDSTEVPVVVGPALEDQMATAAAELSATGQVTVVFTEAQLANYMAERLSTNTDAPLVNPQVLLRDGQIVVSGDLTVAFVKATATFTLRPYIDNGRLQVELVDAKMGSIPIPDDTLTTLTNTINQNLSGLTTIENRQFTLEQVVVADGTITLSGRLD